MSTAVDAGKEMLLAVGLSLFLQYHRPIAVLQLSSFSKISYVSFNYHSLRRQSSHSLPPAAITDGARRGRRGPQSI